MFFEKLKKLFSLKPVPQKTKSGFIKWFNRSRGYGFIRSREDSKDIFFHISDIDGNVRLGQKVKFKVEKNRKRAKAVEIQKMIHTPVKPIEGKKAALQNGISAGKD